MKRRAFLGVLGGAVAWPLARGQTSLSNKSRKLTANRQASDQTTESVTNAAFAEPNIDAA